MSSFTYHGYVDGALHHDALRDALEPAAENSCAEKKSLARAKSTAVPRSLSFCIRSSNLVSGDFDCGARDHKNSKFMSLGARL